MKKNVVLLLSLTLLLVFTFYFQEKKEIFQTTKFNFISNELPDSLVIDDSILQRFPEGYLYRKHLINDESIKKWLSLFQDLEVVGEVEKPFGGVVSRLKLDEHLVRIYELNQMSGNFCIQANGKLYLVASKHEFNGFYKNEIERKARSYEFFVHQLKNLKSNIFSPVFSKVKSFKRIVGDVEKVVSFNDFSTSPAPLKPLGIDKTSFNSFKKKIETLTPINVQDLSTEELEEMATFEVDDSQGVRKFKFYQFGEENYLKDLETQAYLEFKESDLDFLFLPMKEFWNKKIIDLSIVDKLDILIKGESEHKFKVDRQLNIFSDSGKRNKLLEQSLKEILCYMSHCRKNYSYLDVTTLDNSFDNGKNMNILGQSYSLELKHNILHINDKKNNLQFKYLWPLANKENPFLNL